MLTLVATPDPEPPRMATGWTVVGHPWLSQTREDTVPLSAVTFGASVFLTVNIKSGGGRT